MAVTFIGKLRSCETGSTALEYGLIAALVVVASMGALVAMSSTVVMQLNDTSAKIAAAMKNH